MRLLLSSAIAVSLALAACGSPHPVHTPHPHLLLGGGAPLDGTALDAARATAGRFASAYARTVYESSPPPLPSTRPAVEAAIRSATSRVPPSRKGLHPHAANLALRSLRPNRASATVTIADGRSPRFSVGFTLEHRRGRWLITQISPPG